MLLETDSGVISSGIFADTRSLFEQRPLPAVLCIDIPIGLTEAGARMCDIQASAVLGPRRNSVFPAPIRPILGAPTYTQACQTRASIEGKKISKQGFAIYPKVREVDDALAADPSLCAFVREVHPEVCFWAWNGGRPMNEGKKSAEGHAARRTLIGTHFGAAAFSAVRSAQTRTRASDDDIADAFAALWTAQRVHAGDARTLPVNVPVDSRGRRMEMWY